MQFRNLVYPVFQPVVDANGVPVYYEANLRAYGQRTEDGHARLLAVAEEMGFIDALDCIICEAAIEAGIASRCTVGVNVSAFTVQNALEDFIALAGRARPLPSGIVVELTETVQPDRMDLMDQFISEMRRVGARIAIDDYGTGHFESGDVSRIRPEFLKLAMPRVHRSLTDYATRQWLLDTIALADELEARVIAEGVENEVTLHFLKRHGVRLFQGYLWGMPTHLLPMGRIPAAAITATAIFPPIARRLRAVRIAP